MKGHSTWSASTRMSDVLPRACFRSSSCHRSSSSWVTTSSPLSARSRTRADSCTSTLGVALELFKTACVGMRPSRRPSCCGTDRRREDLHRDRCTCSCTGEEGAYVPPSMPSLPSDSTLALGSNGARTPPTSPARPLPCSRSTAAGRPPASGPALLSAGAASGWLFFPPPKTRTTRSSMVSEWAELPSTCWSIRSPYVDAAGPAACAPPADSTESLSALADDRATRPAVRRPAPMGAALPPTTDVPPCPGSVRSRGPPSEPAELRLRGGVALGPAPLRWSAGSVRSPAASACSSAERPCPPPAAAAAAAASAA
mmetsp:Transcript_22518/g.85303  ORF Transcript_22518/g.85303 Transcript_22518/m.85303 type:complete len:313 (-) Transcript_22518:6282-7220(-)